MEALQGLDRNGRVIYAGTFSKLLFPALRLGYLVLPESLVRPFTVAKAVADTGSATFEQRVLADFIRQGRLERHLRRSRTRNAARRTATLEAIARYCGDRVEVSGAHAGLHVLLWLPGIPASETGALRERAAAVGVGVYSIVPLPQAAADNRPAPGVCFTDRGPDPARDPAPGVGHPMRRGGDASGNCRMQQR